MQTDSTFVSACGKFQRHHSLALRCDTIEMAAPLSVYAKEEQRGVIGFLWSEGVTGAEIH